MQGNRAVAQHSADSLRGSLFVPVGSRVENYLRYSQTLGETPLLPWALRPFGPANTLRLTAGRRDGWLAASGHPIREGIVSWQPLSVVGTLWYNTTYPFGNNDGAVWRGRGATAAVEGGVAVRWKVFTAVLDPLAFIAENRGFAMLPTAVATASPFADPTLPTRIDRPQRFGKRSYGRIDPGQSTIRADALGFTAGVSTANMWWGPMSEWPYLIGNNAGGIPNVFVGSSSPWNVGIGRVHGRVFYGGLSQSSYSPTPDSIGGRFATGLAGSFSPRFMPGLELGVARVFSYRWPANGLGWRELRKPLEGLLKDRVTGDSAADPSRQSADNQLASVSFRWVLPRSGFEVYGEFGRDDHNWNGRDLILEPDHSAGYGLGLRKAWRATDERMSGLRTEIFTIDPSTLVRARPAGGGDTYSHFFTRQGHTQDGQVLGAGFTAINGSGSLVALERFAPNGEESSISLTRMVVRQRALSPSVDAQYALAAARTRKLGIGSVSYGITAVYEMNRNFAADVGNVMLTTGIRW